MGLDVLGDGRRGRARRQLPDHDHATGSGGSQEAAPLRAGQLRCGERARIEEYTEVLDP